MAAQWLQMIKLSHVFLDNTYLALTITIAATYGLTNDVIG